MERGINLDPQTEEERRALEIWQYGQWLVMDRTVAEDACFPPREGAWYLRDLNVQATICARTIYFADLTHALRRSGTCRVVQLTARAAWPTAEAPRELDLLAWLESQRFPTVAALYERLREPVELDGAVWLDYERPACRTYSPFAAVRPIAAPERWTSDRLWRAILSGQISEGRVAHDWPWDSGWDRPDRSGEALTERDLRWLALDIIERDRRFSIKTAPLEDGRLRLTLSEPAIALELVFDASKGRPSRR